MDKIRFPLALLLSFIVLFGWSALFGPKPGPGGESAGESSSVAGDGSAESAAGGEAPVTLPPPVADVVEAADRWVEWVELGSPGEPGHYWVRFDNLGGTIAELRLGGYYIQGQLSDEAKLIKENLEPLLLPIDDGTRETRSFQMTTSRSSEKLVRGPLESALWNHELLTDGGRTVGVRFSLSPGTGATFEKIIRRVDGQYELELELSVQSTNAEHVQAGNNMAQFTLTPASCMPKASEDSFYIEPQAVFARMKNRERGEVAIELERMDESASKLSDSFGAGELAYAGVHNKFFAVLLRGETPEATAAVQGTRWQRVNNAELVAEDPTKAGRAYSYIDTSLDVSLRVTEAGATPAPRSFLVYAGPKDREKMAMDFPAHAKLSEKDLGFFTTIAKTLLGILGFFHGLTGNWGWAIILLTLTVRLSLFPLNRRSQTAMAKHQTKMKRIQPRLDELKEKYAKDPTKQRQEQARIMQEEGAFPPLGGCLPVFAQIPIFFGLFQALRTSFDMRQSPFMLWIQDLSAPDRLLKIDLNTHLPFIGTIEYLNVLPILMVVLWILQQKVMPKPTDEQALRMQKMMMWMPIMFGFFLYNYAAGLSLYMITTSTFGILEQTVIKKIWPLDTTEKPRKKSKFMQRLMEMSEQAQELQRQQQAAKARGGGPKGGSKKAGRKR